MHPLIHRAHLSVGLAACWLLLHPATPVWAAAPAAAASAATNTATSTATNAVANTATTAATTAAANPPTARPAPAQDSPGTLRLSPAQATALQLRTQAAEPDLPAGTRHPATVVLPASQQVVLATALPGLVERLQAEVGDTVRAGQVLAVLRSPALPGLQHTLDVAQRQAALANSQRARDEQLLQEGLIAATRWENTRTQAALAQAALTEARRTLAQAGGVAAGGPGGLALVAPISGVVLERPALPGQRLEAGAAVYRLGKLSPLWLELQVPARLAATVRRGDAVTVADSTITGRVLAVAPAVEAASQTVLVRAEVLAGAGAAGPALRVGQAVEVLLSQAQPGLRRVPATALVHEGTQALVFTLAGAGVYQAQPVQVVSHAGSQASVRGLPEGRPVVVQGTAALKALLAAQRP